MIKSSFPLWRSPLQLVQLQFTLEFANLHRLVMADASLTARSSTSCFFRMNFLSLICERSVDEHATTDDVIVCRRARERTDAFFCRVSSLLCILSDWLIQRGVTFLFSFLFSISLIVFISQSGGECHELLSRSPKDNKQLLGCFQRKKKIEANLDTQRKKSPFLSSLYLLSSPHQPRWLERWERHSVSSFFEGTAAAWSWASHSYLRADCRFHLDFANTVLSVIYFQISHVRSDISHQ